MAALKQMLPAFPSHSDSPFFQIPQAGSFNPLTDSAARKHLKQVSSLLGLHSSLTFHDFRRGGGGGGLPGLFSMEFLSRTSRPRAPGLPVVSTDILTSLPPSHKFQLPLLCIYMSSLLSLPLLGVWAPSSYFYITLYSYFLHLKTMLLPWDLVGPLQCSIQGSGSAGVASTCGLN